MVGCEKMDKATGRLSRRLMPLRACIEAGLTRLEDYLVQPEGLIPPYMRRVFGTEKPSRSVSAASPRVSDAEIDRVVEAVVQLSNGALEYEYTTEDGFVHFKRVAQSHCDQCNREHDNRGGYAKKRREGWMYRCWQNREAWTIICAGDACPTEPEVEVQEPESAEQAPPPKPKWSYKQYVGQLVEAAPSVGRLPAVESYTEAQMRPYPVDKKCLAICAPCGTGKTVQLLKYIAEWRTLRALSCARPCTSPSFWREVGTWDSKVIEPCGT